MIREPFRRPCRVTSRGTRRLASVTARTSSGAEVDFAYADEAGRFRLRVPAGEAVDLEARPSKEDGSVRSLDTRSALVAEARGVRAGGGEVVLTLAPRN